GRRGGGSSATQTIAQAGPSAGRPGAEARGPVARAQRRLRAMVRRISRGASGLFAGVKHAFGLGPKGYAAGAAGSATFATASGGAEGSAAVAGGTIGDLGSGRDDKSGGHNVPSTKLVPPPPVPSPKAVNPAQKPKDLQCAAVKAAEADFWSAFDKIQNVNKRYHTTGEQDKDLLVPLMELTAKKFGEFDKKVGEILTELNTLNLSCQECEPLEECRQLAQRTIGTGMGGLDSAARNIQDMVRAGQKGMGLCGPHGYENPGAASECYELGLEMIAMDQKTKTAIDTHIAAVVANKGVGGRECTAPALKADGKPNVGAADANARWEAWAKKDVEQFFKPMQEYLSTGWCSDPRAIEKCTPVRWGQLGVAQTALANLQKSARDFEGFLGSGSGYSSRLAEAAGHVRTAIRYHKNTSADWGKAVFEGVNAEDKAAQVMNGLDLEYAKLAKHCQMPGY
ncbi:MAG: hypothetical protein HY553_19195, partial [Elusimicrobia bacterium]|nr:hypothetical protein [Elusimicrobiota bacterium]